MPRLLLPLLLLIVPGPLLAQLTCQPMVGHVGLRDARIWIQAESAGTALIECRPAPSDVRDGSDILRSLPQELAPASAHTATFDLGGLEPGTAYTYEVILNGQAVTQGIDPDALRFETQPLWQYRFDPPAFTMAVGSCSFINETKYDRPGKPYGGGYGIFNTIAASDPDLMLWLGDNVYFREVDWGSRSGMQHRYSHLRQLPEMQALLGACPHIATWDDHDFGPDDADGSWVHKDWAAETFREFWPNPSQGLAETGGQGIATNPDNRTLKPQMLGQAQLDWLISALQYSEAPFKLVAVGSQVVSDYAGYENMAMFAAERGELLRRIDAEDIRGVVFLTGDRHSSELSSLTLPGGRTVLDFTCSALTSGSYDHSSEPNHNRMEDTMVGIRNYGTLSFSGPRTERVMTIRTMDGEGNLLWEREFATSDL
jgi:alkaline phosphatase D